VNPGLDRSDFAEGDAVAIDRISSLGICEGVVGVTLEPGKSGLLSTDPDTTKERLECKVNPNGDILKHLGVNFQEFRVFYLPFRKFGGLVVVGQRLSPQLIVMLSAVQKAVVDLPTGLKRGLHFRGLRFGRVDTIF
jgi:hypothetical protein